MQYGKFDTAEELLRGYNALEQAFTQKCQQLAKITNGTNDVANVADVEVHKDGTSENASPLLANDVVVTAEHGDNAISDSGTNAGSSPSQTAQGVVAVPLTEQFSVPNDMPTATHLDETERVKKYLQDNPQLVAELLSRVQGSPVPPNVMNGGGTVSMAMPTRPKTLREASELAKKLFD